ncbi:MAG: c-type cytochrome [Terracidiphilus sp.]
MLKFVAGFIVAIIVLIACVFCYVRFGFVNPRADTPVSWLETSIGMPALDASVARHAPDAKNPVPADDADLAAGMKVYQSNCSSCHGDPVHPVAIFANALKPRPPQFVRDVPSMPENQDFYIIEHGIRLSGMPAWKEPLSGQQVWQVTTFLSHMHKLPPDVMTQWKTAASAVPAQ